MWCKFRTEIPTGKCSKGGPSVKNYNTMIKITTISGKSIKTITQQVTILNLNVQGKHVFKNEVKLQRTIS